MNRTQRRRAQRLPVVSTRACPCCRKISFNCPNPRCAHPYEIELPADQEPTGSAGCRCIRCGAAFSLDVIGWVNAKDPIRQSLEKALLVREEGRP